MLRTRESLVKFQSPNGPLTVVGHYNAEGTLLAQAISRAKSNPRAVAA